MCDGSIVSPPAFNVTFVTTKGLFTAACEREWSPHGADRIFQLLQPACGAYNDTVFYRVIDGWVAQFGGIARHSNDTVMDAYRAAMIPDDNVRVGNSLGRLAFSAEYTSGMTHATNRTAELFINTVDNSAALDALGFAPVCEIAREDMDAVVLKLYSGYGEMRDACSLHGFVPCEGPDSDSLACGNACLDADFPLLDRITAAFVSGSSGNSADPEEEQPLSALWWVVNGLAVAVALAALVAMFMAVRRKSGSRWR